MKRIVLTFCVFITLSSLANADFIQCTDKNGNIIFTNTTPPSDYICEGSPGYTQSEPAATTKTPISRQNGTKSHAQRNVKESNTEVEITYEIQGPPAWAVQRARDNDRKATEESQKKESEQSRRVEQASGRSGCEVVNYSQREVNTGGGRAVGRSFHDIYSGTVFGNTNTSIVGYKSTCVDLTIRNNDSVERTLTHAGIVAFTQKGNRRSPTGFMTIIGPSDMYRGTACFGDYLSTIVKMECKF